MTELAPLPSSQEQAHAHANMEDWELLVGVEVKNAQSLTTTWYASFALQSRPHCEKKKE
jgi:hypothetical protein